MTPKPEKLLTDFDEAYRDVVMRVLAAGSPVTNKRTGVLTRALPHQTLTYAAPAGMFSIPHVRRVYPHIAAAEVAWMISADRSIAWLKKYAHIWDKFTDEDDKVLTAYGFRWRHHFGRDQLAGACATLADDASDRQCVVLAWDPAEDGLGTYGVQRKNVPCLLGFSLQVLEPRLFMDVYVRSSDVAVGLLYDYMAYSLLGHAIARQLGLVLDRVTLRLSHAHIYEPHFNRMIQLVNTQTRSVDIPAPDHDLAEIEDDPDDYVETVRDLQRGHLSPWDIKLEVIQ